MENNLVFKWSFSISKILDWFYFVIQLSCWTGISSSNAAAFGLGAIQVVRYNKLNKSSVSSCEYQYILFNCHNQISLLGHSHWHHYMVGGQKWSEGASNSLY